VPAWQAVFTAGRVNFQEDDALFHLRTIHNLLAHFPHRSGFDPYALFPGGLDIPTGPFWDYLIASTAWLLALGTPSPLFIERVAAWLPAILGALFPIGALLLAQRFFDATAGRFAALWVAIIPGTFLWMTHLGLADHHGAEAFWSFGTLLILCTAVEASGTRRLLLAVLGGVAMGAFLATRPAGIFVPAILACAAIWEPLAALPVLVAAATASLLFIPVTGALWSQYTWMALACAVALPAASLGFDRLAQRRGWPRASAAVAALAAICIFAAAFSVVQPGLLTSLWLEVQRVRGVGPEGRLATTVSELHPIFLNARGSWWDAVSERLGVVWIPALPVLAWFLWEAVRTRRPALRLFATWSLVMTIGAVMQERMVVYFAPVAAVLAGCACARLVRWKRPIYHYAAAAVLVVLVTALNLPAAIHQVQANGASSQDWYSALDWLRQNSPEPFSDPRAWWRYRGRLPNGAPSELANWGVAVWWDKGWAVEEIAHRVPMANGTQAGAMELARFYTETSPEAAVAWLQKAGARYVIVDPSMPVLGNQNSGFFFSVLQILGRSFQDYIRDMVQGRSGIAWGVTVYLPDYYRTMAARLYLFDGAEVAGTGPWLLQTRPMKTNDAVTVDVITWSRHFASEAEASAYKAEHSEAKLIMGCLDPLVSCFRIPAVHGLRRVYASDPSPVSAQAPIRAVKIFQVTGETAQTALLK
jgi:asparagine N-glycosylation enzyme membrane subunit Stt3